MSFLEPKKEGGGLNPFNSMSFLVHDERHKRMVGSRPKVGAVPNPGDLQNRLDDQEKRRLLAGGRNSTRVSETGAPAGGARPTLTGLGG